MKNTEKRRKIETEEERKSTQMKEDDRHRGNRIKHREKDYDRHKGRRNIETEE
jgi:hypothetical protein